MTLASPAFADYGSIPAAYTCDGAGTVPPLQWTGVPAGTASLALIVDDPDSPSGQFTHWLAWNIPPASTGLDAGTWPLAGAVEGTNDADGVGWFGPCPHQGEHRYVFQLYALDQMLDLAPGAGNDDVNAAFVDEAKVLGAATLTGKYRRAGT
jgi:Raf kinase inhibitor-like YbhB/YbcL family protein